MLLMMFGLGCVVFGFRCRFFHFLQFGFFVHTLLFRMHFVFAVCRSDRSKYQAGSRNHQRGHLNQFFHIYLLSRGWFEVKIRIYSHSSDGQILMALTVSCCQHSAKSVQNLAIEVWRHNDVARFWKFTVNFDKASLHISQTTKSANLSIRAFFQTASIIFCRLLLLQSRHLQRRRLS